MKKIIRTLFICVTVILLTSCVIACDGSGRSSTIKINYFRNDGQFVLPIKVTKVTVSPDPLRHFHSKQSIEQMAQEIKDTSKYDVESSKDYLVIKTLDKKNYCLIATCNEGQYNYLITNMSCTIESPNHVDETYNRRIIVPFFWIEEPIVSDLGMAVLEENKEYGFTSSLNELQSFYTKQGYEVSALDNTLTITDTTGAKTGTDDNYNFEEIIKKVKITVNGSKISFEILEV
ncbi:MAG TPA: hypothetical protein PKX91_01625 [Clostridia bacterium]|mgnify:CR=1 FL=1|jgi:hypothetical protein|nr:hypothetical protein [Clostridia bacterium]